MFRVGDKVRYRLDGATASMHGLEGYIKELGNDTCMVELTKGNSTHDVGENIYPNNFNLELLSDVVEEAVVHPAHYGGDTTYEAIKVIEAWELGFHLGNTVKYISRAGKKNKDKLLEDLKKARWYLDKYIAFLEK